MAEEPLHVVKIKESFRFDYDFNYEYDYLVFEFVVSNTRFSAIPARLVGFGAPHCNLIPLVRWFNK